MRRLAAVGLTIEWHAACRRGRGTAAANGGVTFRDIGREAGVVFRHVNGASPDKHFDETMGSGGLFFDYDNDGWIDIFLVDGGSMADPGRRAAARGIACTATGATARSRTSTAPSGIRHRDYGMGACAGDYDNDGRVDLYVTNVGPNALYRNRRDGTFADVTAQGGVGSPLWSTSCAFADLDRDGDLDLFVTNYVDAGAQRNPFCGNAQPRVRFYCHPLNFQPLPNVALPQRRQRRLHRRQRRVRASAAHRGNGLGVAVADYDDDRWPDVFVANDGLPNFLFHNSGGMALHRDRRCSPASRSPPTAPPAPAWAPTPATTTATAGSIWSSPTTRPRCTACSQRSASGLFAYATAESGIGPATLPFVGFGVVFLDFDNDAQLDLAIVNGHVMDNAPRSAAGATHAQRNLLLRNTTAGRFATSSRDAGPGFALAKSAAALAAGDIDNDGDLDLLVTNNGRPPTCCATTAATAATRCWSG